MKSNEQTENNKQNRDRFIDSAQMTASGEHRGGGGGMEQKGKRTHGHGQQCGDCCGTGAGV